MFWYGSTKYIRVLSIDGWNELDDDVRAVVVVVARERGRREVRRTFRNVFP